LYISDHISYVNGEIQQMRRSPIFLSRIKRDKQYGIRTVHLIPRWNRA
jgi:hypothetical protein